MTYSIWEQLQILSKLKEAGKLSSDVGIRPLQPLGSVVEEVSTCVERMALATIAWRMS